MDPSTVKSSSRLCATNTAVAPANKSSARTSKSSFFTSFVGLLAIFNTSAVQVAASPTTSSTLDGSLTTVANTHSSSTTTDAFAGPNIATLEETLFTPVGTTVLSGFVKRADQPSGVSFGDALKQHKEIQDDLTANGLKYEGGAIVPDGDKKAKDERKRKMWLGLGLGLGLSGAFLTGLAVHTWGPGLFNYMRGFPVEAAKMFNLENANIEVLEKTLENLAREVLPTPPAPVDAPVQGSSPLQPGQAANLPAESSVELAAGSTTNLGLGAGGTASLPAGAAVQAGADIEVVASGTGTVVTNVGQAVADVGVTIAGGSGGVMQIGSTAATLSSATGGEIAMEVINGKPVYNVVAAGAENMAGQLSDAKKLPDSWDAVEDTVKADQDQRADKEDKGKEPDRPEGRPKDAGEVEQLQEVHDKKRAESERAEDHREKLEREIKQYNGKIKEEKKKGEDFQNELEKRLAEVRNREKENESSGKKWKDMQSNIDKLKKGSEELEKHMKKAKDSFAEMEKKKAEYEKQEKDFKKETVDKAKQAEESKKRAEESKRKVQEEEKKRAEAEKRLKDLDQKLRDEQKKEKAAETRKSQTATRIRVVIEHTRNIEGEITKIEVELKEVTRSLDKSKNRLKLAKKALLAAREKANQGTVDSSTRNRCGETRICQAHPKGGELCWHPAQDQKAKQCWRPRNLQTVLQGFGSCGKPVPMPPGKWVCKGQEGIPSLEEVQKHHKGCPLVMDCPGMLPPLDFTRCKPRYRCHGCGILEIAGDCLGIGHGNSWIQGNQTLSDLGENGEEDMEVDMVEEGAAIDEDADDLEEEDQIEEGDIVEAVDEDTPVVDETKQEASPAGGLAPTEDNMPEEVTDAAENTAIEVEDATEVTNPAVDSGRETLA